MCIRDSVIVDDGSKDRTFDIARNYINTYKSIKKNSKSPSIILVRHKTNRGKAFALNTGVKHSTGDIVIFTDADCTYPSCHFPELVSEIKKGADIVVGSRFMPAPPQCMSFSHKLGNKLFSSLVSYISASEITDSQSGLRAFRKEIFPEINVKARSLEYEPKATARAAKLGYKIKEIPIGYNKRVGKSKIHAIKDPFKILFSLIHIGYSETTLLARTIMIPSFILFLIGIIIGGIILKEYITTGLISRPYYPLLTTLSLILGTQFFSLGLIIDNITKKLTRIEERAQRK